MLKFIGTGSAFNQDLGNTSAYIKDGETLLLIDCGETVFQRIKEIKLLDDVKKVYIAITHNHSDHIGSLGSLVEYLYFIKEIVPNFVLANGDNAVEQEKSLRDYLTSVGVAEDKYDFVYGDMMEEVLTNLLKVEMPQVKHSKVLTSYAVELYFKDLIIYYTGDQNDLSYLKKIAKKLKENDLVYTDCSLRDYKNRIHVTLAELEEIFTEEQRDKVICMHFENYNTYSEAKNAGFKVANKELSKEEILKRIAEHN